MKVSVIHVFCMAVASLLTMLLLSSCGHDEQRHDEYIIVDTTLTRVEKEVYQVGKEAPKEEAQPTAPLRPAKNTTPSLRHDGEDNLRGFDPASEDDMPDNGMRRYMENDDEEGWD